MIPPQFDLECSRSDLWGLDPEVVHLNHGAFGACPTQVLEKQQSLQWEMEANTLYFFERRLPELLTEARGALAGFVGAAPQNLALVPNTTTGVNTVLASFPFQAGDEVLVTDHGYNACSNAARYFAGKAGVRVVTAQIPFPISGPAEVLERVLSACTERTSLVLIDHVTSPTGLLFPVEDLVPELHRRSIQVLVDGAHVPGMFPVHLESLEADYYTGNCHKWLCAPKGTAFLYVRPDHRGTVHPLNISHGMNMPLGDSDRFRLEFDWTGTDDPTRFLCIPQVIEHLSAQFEGGFSDLMARNHALAVAGRAILCEALDLRPPCPQDMLGSLAALILPHEKDALLDQFTPEPLHEALSLQYGIEVPVFSWPSPAGRYLRISAQLYNCLSDFRQLARAVTQELGRG
jgi:isopenicillin-N epimerase